MMCKRTKGGEQKKSPGSERNKKEGSQENEKASLRWEPPKKTDGVQGLVVFPIFQKKEKKLKVGKSRVTSAQGASNGNFSEKLDTHTQKKKRKKTSHKKHQTHREV